MKQIKKQYTALFMALLLVTVVNAQVSMDEVLDQIQMNNKSLQALRQSTDAVKLGNSTGLNPANPEAEVGYLWGSPGAIGNRTDLSVTQTFDFPTAYAYRNKMAGSLNEQAESAYRQQFNQVMLQARLVCHELVYLNALQFQYKERLEHAQQLADAFHKQFETGEVNRLELNKADLNLLNARNALAGVEADRTAVLEQLQALNGGITIDFNAPVWTSVDLPAAFDDWFNEQVVTSPQMQNIEQALSASRYQEQMNRALSLPKLSAGYTSERLVGETFSGISVGLTIPLWENKNTVKQAQMQSLAVEKEMADTRLQLYHGLKAHFERAQQLQQSVSDYKQTLDGISNTDLLKMALESGEISILEYLMELSFYYDTYENALETERNFNDAVARLMAFLP